MKFLKVIDRHERVQILNPRYILNIQPEESGTRIIYDDSRYTLTAIEPSFDEIVAQLTGVPLQEEEVE